MARKSRRINTRRIKRDYSYLVQEFAECLGVHKNTVRNYIKDGLPVIDDQRPQRIHGSDGIDFLNEKQARRKCKCAANELYCFKCRCPRQPVPGTARLISVSKTRLNISGKCEECGTGMNKGGSEVKRVEYIKTFGIERQAGEHITETSSPSLNCYSGKDELHA
tara:strand:- start:115 stop:606 length:492 start_codon:yes stop_codon:yes gene_type:complete